MPNLQSEKKQELLKVLETVGNNIPLALTHDNVKFNHDILQIKTVLWKLINETL